MSVLDDASKDPGLGNQAALLSDTTSPTRCLCFGFDIGPFPPTTEDENCLSVSGSDLYLDVAVQHPGDPPGFFYSAPVLGDRIMPGPDALADFDSYLPESAADPSAVDLTAYPPQDGQYATWLLPWIYSLSPSHNPNGQPSTYILRLLKMYNSTTPIGSTLFGDERRDGIRKSPFVIPLASQKGICSAISVFVSQCYKENVQETSSISSCLSSTEGVAK